MADNRIDSAFNPKFFEELKQAIAGLNDVREAVVSASKQQIDISVQGSAPKTLVDLAGNQIKLQEATQQTKTSFDSLEASMQRVEALKAKYNGTTDTLVGLSKKVASAEKEVEAAQLQRAKAETEASKTRLNNAKAEAEAARTLFAERKRQILEERELDRLIAKEESDNLKKKVADERTARAALESIAKEKASSTPGVSLDPTTLKYQSDRLRELRQGYDLLTQSERENEHVGGVLLTRIQELDVALKATDASKGVFNRNVGNYRDGFSGLNNSIQQILREAPSAAVSLNTFFLAISNNLPIFFDELQKINKAQREANGLIQEEVIIAREAAAAQALQAGATAEAAAAEAALAEQTVLANAAQGKAPGILAQIGKSLFSVNSLLTAGVLVLTLFGGKIVDAISEMLGFGDSTEKAKKEQEDFKKSLEETTRELERQIDTLYKSREREGNRQNNGENEAKRRLDLLKAQGASEKELLDAQLEYDAKRKQNLENEKNSYVLIRDEINRNGQFFREQEKARGFPEGALNDQFSTNIQQTLRNELKLTADEAKKQADIIAQSYGKPGSVVLDLQRKVVDLNERIKDVDNDSAVSKAGGKKTKSTPIANDYYQQDINYAKQAEEERQKNQEASIKQYQEYFLQIAEDEKYSLDERLAAYNEYIDRKKDLLILEKDSQILEAKNTQRTLQAEIARDNSLISGGKLSSAQIANLKEKNSAIEGYIAALNLTIKRLLTERVTETNSIELTAAGKRTDIAESEAKQDITFEKDRLETIKASFTDQYKVEKDALDKRKLNKKQYNEELKKLDNKYAGLVLDEQIARLGKVIEKDRLEGIATKELQAILDGLIKTRAELGKAGNGNQFGISDKELKNLKTAADTASALLNDFNTLANARSQQRQSAIDKEIAGIDKKKQADIDAINASVLSEDAKAKKIAEINAKAQADEDAANEKKKQQQHADAVREKELKIALAVINGALFVLESSSLYEAIARGVVVAAEIATIAATPIPEFAVGTDSSPEGLAKVGERGRELIVPPAGKGKPYIADKEMTAYLHKGTQVKTHTETEQLFRMFAFNTPGLYVSRESKDAALLEELQESREVLKAIRDKRIPVQHGKPAWWQDYKYQKTR